jgi:hypothetical protein
MIYHLCLANLVKTRTKDLNEGWLLAMEGMIYFSY